MSKSISTLSLVLFFVQVACAQLRYNYSGYSFEALQGYPFKESPIVLKKIIEQQSGYTSYEGQYQTMSRKMSLFVGIPHQASTNGKVIIMSRAFQQHYNYATGQAIQEVAKVYLQAGYVVVAPDFFGFGHSEEAPIGGANSAETYLMMPINITIRFDPLLMEEVQQALPGEFTQVAFWGQGDGGYVMLHALALLKEPIPTILWSPVTVDFVQAWSFFRSQYSAVASKSAQKFVDDFQQLYNISDYDISANLPRLAQTTPIKLNHGQADAIIPLSWSRNFIQQVQQENEQRQQNNQLPIALEYALIPQANHNLASHSSNITAGDLAWLQSAWEKR
jgi:pimeloyl-ACP methyl ester carboxylesterase